ncbi:hypothetical protein QYF36_005120 [Acer negundo]|nr:hypothetical protein QYF36_005120 [Acer negundo]
MRSPPLIFFDDPDRSVGEATPSISRATVSASPTISSFSQIFFFAFFHMSRGSESKKTHDCPSGSGSGSEKSSPLSLSTRKRNNHPLSDDEGGSLPLRRSSNHVRVKSGFTNTADSPLSVSRIKDKKYGPLDLGGNPFNKSWVDAVLRMFAPAPGVLLSDASHSSPVIPRSRDALLMTPPRSLKLAKVKKEEGSKHRLIPVGILKLPLASSQLGSSSVLELKARLGYDCGKPSILASLSPAHASGSTSLKTASASIYPSKPSLDKGKGILKFNKAPVPKEKEVLALSDEKVVVVFKCCCPGGGVASLSLTPTSEVVAKGSAIVAEGFKCFLALEQPVVSFQEELRLYERRRAAQKPRLNKLSMPCFTYLRRSGRQMRLKPRQLGMRSIRSTNWKKKCSCLPVALMKGMS